MINTVEEREIMMEQNEFLLFKEAFGRKIDFSTKPTNFSPSWGGFGCFKKRSLSRFYKNKRYKPQSKPWELIPLQWAGYLPKVINKTSCLIQR